MMRYRPTFKAFVFIAVFALLVLPTFAYAHPPLSTHSPVSFDKPDNPGKPDKPDKPGKPDKPDKPTKEWKMHGIVTAMPADGLIGEWKIGKRTIRVTEATTLEGDAFAIGALVNVRFVRASDRALEATSLQLKQPKINKDRARGKAYGTIDELPTTGGINVIWTIGGIPYVVTPQTILHAKRIRTAEVTDEPVAHDDVANPPDEDDDGGTDDPGQTDPGVIDEPIAIDPMPGDDEEPPRPPDMGEPTDPITIPDDWEEPWPPCDPSEPISDDDGWAKPCPPDMGEPTDPISDTDNWEKPCFPIDEDHPGGDCRDDDDDDDDDRDDRDGRDDDDDDDDDRDDRDGRDDDDDDDDDRDDRDGRDDDDDDDDDRDDRDGRDDNRKPRIGEFALGDCVMVHYRMSPTGDRIAHKIQFQKDKKCDGGNRHVGIVDQLPEDPYGATDGQLIVDGEVYEVDDTIAIDDELTGGLFINIMVQVIYKIENGVKVAVEIKTFMPPDSGEDITGVLTNCHPDPNIWCIGDLRVLITDATLLEDDLSDVEDLQEGQPVECNVYEMGEPDDGISLAADTANAPMIATRLTPLQEQEINDPIDMSDPTTPPTTNNPPYTLYLPLLTR